MEKQSSIETMFTQLLHRDAALSPMEDEMSLRAAVCQQHTSALPSTTDEVQQGLLRCLSQTHSLGCDVPGCGWGLWEPRWSVQRVTNWMTRHLATWGGS